MQLIQRNLNTKKLYFHGESQHGQAYRFKLWAECWSSSSIRVYDLSTLEANFVISLWIVKQIRIRGMWFRTLILIQLDRFSNRHRFHGSDLATIGGTADHKIVELLLCPRKCNRVAVPSLILFLTPIKGDPSKARESSAWGNCSWAQSATIALMLFSSSSVGMISFLSNSLPKNKVNYEFLIMPDVRGLWARDNVLIEPGNHTEGCSKMPFYSISILLVEDLG